MARVDLVAVGGMDVEAEVVPLSAFVADRSSLVPAVFFPRVSMAGNGRVQRVEVVEHVLFKYPKAQSWVTVETPLLSTFFEARDPLWTLGLGPHAVFNFNDRSDDRLSLRFTLQFRIALLHPTEQSSALISTTLIIGGENFRVNSQMRVLH